LFCWRFLIFSPDFLTLGANLPRRETGIDYALLSQPGFTGFDTDLSTADDPAANDGRDTSQAGKGRPVKKRRRQMESDKLLQRFPSPDGKRWFELRQQSDGLFYFREFSEATDAVPIYGAESYTSPGFRSGLYGSAKAAEDDLRKMVPWLGGIAK
jgi:hypothetical protein